MPLIQFNIPKDIDNKLKIYMAENDLDDKRKAVIMILKDKFQLTVKQGLRNLIK